MAGVSGRAPQCLFRNLADVVEVTARDRWACALDASGHVACWASNTWGLGDNAKTVQANVPVRVAVAGTS